ncbi:MAG: glycosyltransferase, partial [Planctomycetes bacterium]|nr:glycosyltransferase [Planctomycetota bacterium]
IEAGGAFLEENNLVGEIIVVDDGSEDDTAEAAEKATVPEGMGKKVIRLEKNRGKGFAVRSGILATSGNYVMFADSGVCIRYQFALKGLALLRSGSCEMAHGSRKLPESVIVHSHYVHRQVSSKLFRWLAVNYAGIPNAITDSQCGFKMYRGDIGRELFEECQSERFMFDVEIILRA